MVYEFDDDFYDESGSLSFENGELKFIKDITKTIVYGQLWSDSIDENCLKHGANSLAEFVEIYKQYAAEGNTREFLRFD